MNRDLTSPALRLLSSTLPLLALAALVGGCGGDTTVVCNPECPNGSHCTESGCVPNADRDLAAATDDLAGPACSPACMGATPYCGPKGICQPCLTDDNCPAGNICKSLGNTTACIPGCADDARCGAMGSPMKCCSGQCLDTSKDAQNCGACGMSCGGMHGTAKCAGGVCQLGMCAAGWGDCNANPADGCEANLSSDAGNCTACGMACKIANAISGCANGCYIRACVFGFDDCNGDAKDGCEMNVLSNAQNCGACGVPCLALAHGKNSCVNGGCSLTSCDAGYGDCDRNPANGCEVTLASDAQNCGSCGVKCAQGLICSQGICTCPQCNLPNAKSTCVNLQCAVAQCNVNWGDCDGLPQNGCERDLTSDAANCGQCGKVCAQGLVCTNGSCTCPNCVLPNARTACINNMCVLDQCFPGWGNCDGNSANGCEMDLTTSKANCGACGNACPMNLPNCVAGMCVLAPQLVGKFNVSDGPAWGGNPPCYTCQEACAKLFSGNPGDYACSTQMNVIDHKAWEDGWGDTSHCKAQNNPVAEDYKKSVNYNCGGGGCAFSAYVMDHGCADTNYCFR